MKADSQHPLPDSPVGDLLKRAAEMDRLQLIGMLRSLHCGFELDFTDEFLETVSLERLRHIVVAAALHARTAPCRLPQ
jgi:hypothetical protein